MQSGMMSGARTGGQRGGMRFLVHHQLIVPHEPLASHCVLIRTRSRAPTVEVALCYETGVPSHVPRSVSGSSLGIAQAISFSMPHVCNVV